MNNSSLDELRKVATAGYPVSPSEPPAVKVHAREILYRASQIEPDLKQELIDSIEWRLNEESAGIRNRGEKLLGKLYGELQ